MSRPNILWICTDQQRFDTLGCTGNPFVRTPVLDQLAADGVLFEHAFCQSPVCTPSRASFLTGRYPRTTRCRQNGQAIPEEEILVTKLLADTGYRCGLAGKLHLSPCEPRVCPEMERRIDDGYSEFHWSHHPAPSWPTNAYCQWVRDRGGKLGNAPFADSTHVQIGPDACDHQTTWCAEKAIEFLTANAGSPWLFSVNFFDPHHAFDPPAPYLERYRDRLHSIPLPDYDSGELAQKPIFQQIDHEGAYRNAALHPFNKMTETDHRWVRAAYWAMCDLIDDQIGRILNALQETGQSEHTLVIFMSDHGEMLGDHGIYLKGPYFYEPAIRVPLFISQPGTIPASRREPNLVELTDIAPTLLEAAGLPIHPGMQGRSLWPLLQGHHETGTHRTDIYCEYLNAMPWHREPRANATMIRTATHKLAVQHGTDCGELYDLVNDPGEKINHWNDPAFAAIQGTLLKRLCDRLAWTADPLPVRQSAW